MHYIDKILDVYNKLFFLLMGIFIFVLFIKGLQFYQEKDTDDQWGLFLDVIKKKCAEVFMSITICWIAVILLNEIFSIDILSIIKISKYWKVIVGGSTVILTCSGRRFFHGVNFLSNIRRIKLSKDENIDPKVYIQDVIENSKAHYELEVERFGMLKSLTPISLVPLFAGYIIEGKEITVDWNLYTIILFMLLGLYIYMIWNCFGNMRIWKRRELYARTQFMDMQEKNMGMKEKQYDDGTY